MALDKLSALCAGAAWLLCSTVAGADDAVARETAGWHLIRPGEDLTAIANLYLGRGSDAALLQELNPHLVDPSPGERVQIRLEAGLPADSAIVGRLAGRVDEQPTPVPWTRGRRFDLLAEGDGLRTFTRSSVEMSFADSSRVLVTEDSLVFLHDSAARPAARHPGAIEVVAGQADLAGGALQRPDRQAIEVILHEARARPRSNHAGELSARARRDSDGTSQLMVYQGSSDLEAAGVHMRLPEGTGSVIPPNGPPTPPERLLPAPVLLSQASSDSSDGSLDLAWAAVEGAASYTFELCVDPDCGELVRRTTGTAALDQRLADLPAGRYFWRVTATSPSRLDGYPSPSAQLSIHPAKAPPPPLLVSAEPLVMAGIVRSRFDGTLLPGAQVRVSGTDREVTTGSDGQFELRDLSAGRYALDVRFPGFVVAQLEGVQVVTGASTEVEIFLDVAPVTRDEISVRASRLSLLQSEPTAPLALDREQILSLPHLGDDIFRALPLLPGTAANDVTAQFHIRGGRRDEVQVLLDGQELYGAYHLKDFDSALSIVAPASLGGVELTTGGSPAQFGDRTGGVLDMRSLVPETGRATSLGLGSMSQQVGSAGNFSGGRGSWLGIARRGSLSLMSRFFGVEKPRFWDAFGKLTVDLGRGQSLTGRALVSDDRLDFLGRDDGELKDRSTHHDSAYLWASHQALFGSSLFVDTHASWSELTSRREALELEAEQHLEVNDRRSFTVTELRQEWNLQLGADHFTALGASRRHFAAPFDYFSFQQYSTPVALLRTQPPGEHRFLERLSGDHTGTYVNHRMNLHRLVLELGLRYDQTTLPSERHLSPRLNVAWALGDSTVLRAGWGRYFQTQRPYELGVEDGDTDLFPAERSDQFLLGFERVLPAGSRLAGGVLRIEAYDRAIGNPRPRWENLYEPFNTFPELEPDRVRIVPERTSSRGLELFLRGPQSARVGWWVNYTFSRSEDRIDGRAVPRSIDQPHALNVSVDFPIGRQWHLALAWRAHTGWPTTPLRLDRLEPPDDPDDGGEGEGEGDDGELADVSTFPVLGPLNSERLGFYHRLDLRASRSWQTRRGTRTFFVDIQNVYDRRNESGFDMLFDEETGMLDPFQERWPGILPSFGIRWEL